LQTWLVFELAHRAGIYSFFKKKVKGIARAGWSTWDSNKARYKSENLCLIVYCFRYLSKRNDGLIWIGVRMRTMARLNELKSNSNSRTNLIIDAVSGYQLKQIWLNYLLASPLHTLSEQKSRYSHPRKFL
jgi:hypothetical protein